MSVYSHRDADRAPPGGYSEQQQTDYHSSCADWSEEHAESPKSQKKGKSEKTHTPIILHTSVWHSDFPESHTIE